MIDRLLSAACAARQRAYCPYSKYAVGAALMDENGEVHSGCNVENSSYPVSQCAERNALAAMVLSGAREIRAVAVSTRDGAPPCGACLQALNEFVRTPETVPVWLCDEHGSCKEWRFSDLLPVRFDARKR